MMHIHISADDDADDRPNIDEWVRFGLVNRKRDCCLVVGEFFGSVLQKWKNQQQQLFKA